MNSTERAKLLAAGQRVMRIYLNECKILELTQEGNWLLIGKHSTDFYLQRHIDELGAGDETIVFEVDGLGESLSEEENLIISGEQMRASSERLVMELAGEDNLPTPPLPMTPTEARAKHEQLKSIHHLARSLLLEMRDRKGWQALGFASFEAYGEQEWNYNQSYIYRLSKAEEIQSTLSPIGEIPETHLRPLGAVPADERQAIFDEANRKAEAAGQERTAKMVTEAVKDWQDKLDKAEKLRNILEHEFDSLVEIAVKSQVEEKEQALQGRLDAAMGEVQQDYQAKIDDQKDVIARLTEQLTVIKSNTGTDAQLRQLSDINQQIATKKEVLTALQKQQDDTFTRKKIDDDFAVLADQLSGKVAAFINDLLLSYSGDTPDLYPKLEVYPRNRNKMRHAAQVFNMASEKLFTLIQE